MQYQGVGFLLSLLFLCVALPISAGATSASTGIDTPTGVDNLPLSVGGNEMVNIQSTGGMTIGSGAAYAGGTPPTSAPANGLIVEGSTGIGITDPVAALDVNGAVRATGSTIYSGTSYPTVGGNFCAPSGAMAYDATNNAPLFCSSNTNKWVSTSFTRSWQSFPQSSRTWNTMYTNNSGHEIVVGVSFSAACSWALQIYDYPNCGAASVIVGAGQNGMPGYVVGAPIAAGDCYKVAESCANWAGWYELR